MLFVSAVALALSFVVNAQGAAVVSRSAVTCADGTEAKLISTTVVDGFPLTLQACALAKDANATALDGPLNKDAGYNLVGAPCTTYCYTPAGGGPDPNDCQALANEYAGDGDFTLSSGYAYYWTLRSCQVTQSNYLTPAGDIYYSYNTANWAGIVSYIAWNCQATQNAHGGTCNFYNSQSISNIVVQTS